jgi:hypothetical protein
MSTVGEAFLKQVGPPNPKKELGFKFSMEWDQIVLDDIYEEIGAGEYYNGFLHLLGTDISPLNDLLKYWSFLFSDNNDRKVIGRNAYGSLLIIENESDEGTVAPVGYLDLINCQYVKNENLDFTGLIGNWIPNNRLTNLLESSIYESFINDGKIIQKDEIVAIKVPVPLGGKLEKENFQIENIFEYHSSISKIYQKSISK